MLMSPYRKQFLLRVGRGRSGCRVCGANSQVQSPTHHSSGGDLPKVWAESGVGNRKA